jgi:hypothetical protein
MVSCEFLSFIAHVKAMCYTIFTVGIKASEVVIPEYGSGKKISITQKIRTMEITQVVVYFICFPGRLFQKR